MIFDIISETVSWERWEGTIEYTFMSPASRASQLIGMGIYAVMYGMMRAILMFGAISLFFDLSLDNANYAGALAILVALLGVAGRIRHDRRGHAAALAGKGTAGDLHRRRRCCC